MNLINLVDYLLDSTKLNQLYIDEGLETESEALLIYMEKKLDIYSKISIFKIEETEDNILYKKDDIEYIQLFPLAYALDLIENDLDLKNKGYKNEEIALRLLDYRIKDA